MLVGRDLECARLGSLIDATRAGDGDAVLLRGVPGAGKSALLDFAAGRSEDLAVLRASGIPGEAEVAFAGVLEMLRPVLHLLPELPRPQREALGGALAWSRRSSATASSWAQPRWGFCCSHRPNGQCSLRRRCALAGRAVARRAGVRRPPARRGACRDGSGGARRASPDARRGAVGAAGGAGA